MCVYIFEPALAGVCVCMKMHVLLCVRKGGDAEGKARAGGGGVHH